MENQCDTSTENSIKKTQVTQPHNFLVAKKEIEEVSELSNIVHYLNNEISHCESSIELCKKLLSYKSFSHFRTINIFIHEKGLTTAIHHEVQSKGLSTKNIHIKDFNTLFQAIKKSKNRTYGQNNLKGTIFELVGTFMAREFALKKYNIIFVISRNDFLPQTDIEKNDFNRLIRIIPPYLENVLEQELEKSVISKSKLVLSLLPLYLEYFKTSNEGEIQLPSGRSVNITSHESYQIDSADVYHQERVSLLGELLNTLKHELSNPLFGLQLSVDLLRQDIQDKDTLELLDEASQSIKRSQSIITDFTNLYTNEKNESVINLEKIINEVFTLTKSESRSVFKTFECNVDDGVISNVRINNPTWLVQILFNLIVNSAQALNENKTKVPQIKLTVNKRKENLDIHIHDNGPGIPTDKIGVIFNPFYTTKEKGTGLGLAICKTLARKLNGELKYIEGDQGAHFVLTLPYENIIN
jgi:two-component system NtrC family sensor kinase